MLNSGRSEVEQVETSGALERRPPSAPWDSRVDDSTATGSSGSTVSCGELDLPAVGAEALRARRRPVVLGSGGGRRGADDSNTAPPWKAPDAVVSSPSRSRLFFKSLFSPRTFSSSSSSSSSALPSPPLSVSPRSSPISGSSSTLPLLDLRLTRWTTVGCAGSADDLGKPPLERSVSGGSSLGPSESTLQEESPLSDSPWRVRISPPSTNVIDVDYRTLSPSDVASHLFNGTIAGISRDEVCNIIGQ
ncbi:hypothetical protein HK405_005397, partial [Cladochytrium tenue]